MTFDEQKSEFHDFVFSRTCKEHEDLQETENS